MSNNDQPQSYFSNIPIADLRRHLCAAWDYADTRQLLLGDKYGNPPPYIDAERLRIVRKYWADGCPKLCHDGRVNDVF